MKPMHASHVRHDPTATIRQQYGESVAVTETRGRWYWNPPWHRDAEHWNGPFATRQEAVDDGQDFMRWHKTT